MSNRRRRQQKKNTKAKSKRDNTPSGNVSQNNQKSKIKKKFFRDTGKKVDPALLKRRKELLDGFSETLRGILFTQVIDEPFPVLYHKIYEMVVPPIKSGPKLYEIIVSSVTEYIGSEFMAAARAGNTDEEVMLIVAKEWRKLKASIDIIIDLSLTIDRLYVHGEDISIIKDVILDTFQKKLNTNKFIECVMKQSINYVEMDRNGADIDRDIINSISSMYYDYRTLEHYEPFERIVLESTNEYYAAEAKRKWSEIDDGAEFVSYAYERASEEIIRAKEMFLISSLPKLTAATIESLVSQYSEHLIRKNNGIQDMILNDRYEDLSKLYYLFNNLEGGITILNTVIAQLVKEEGGNYESRYSNPMKYIQNVFSLRKKYDDIWFAVKKDNKIRNAIDKAFSFFLDNNISSVQYLIEYSNTHFVRFFRQMEEAEIDSTLDNIVSIFKLLGDKLSFESQYKKELAGRLLRNWTCSIEKENLMVDKLRAERGVQFSHKLEGILNDISQSKILGEEFIQSHPDLPLLPVSFAILSRSIWPRQREISCSIPEEMHIWKDAYFDFWIKRKSETLKVPPENLLLVWQPNLGVCVITAQLGERNYTIKLSTTQTSILLQFNEAEYYTFTELQNVCKLSTSELEKDLYILVRYKLIEKNDDDRLMININFNYKSNVFEIMPISTSDVEKKKKMLEVLDAYRRDLIEASIVRLVKHSRTPLLLNDLVSQVVDTLSDRFNANKDIVVNRLRVLTEKQYIFSNENNEYIYQV